MKIKMTPIQIIGLKSQLRVCLDVLQRLGCVQIDPIDDSSETAPQRLILDRDALGDQEHLRLLHSQVEGLLDVLEIDDEQSVQRLPDSIEDIAAGVAELTPQAQSLIYRREELEAERDSLPPYESTLDKLLPILPDSADEPGNQVIGVLISREHRDILQQVQKEILEITGGRSETVAGNIDETTRAMLVVFPDEYAEPIGALLGAKDVSRLRLPDEYGDIPLDQALRQVRQRLNAIPDELEILDREIQSLAAQWRERLIQWQQVLNDKRIVYEVMSHLGETDQAFVLEGWVPARDRKRLETALGDCDETTLVTERPLTDDIQEKMPVVLENAPPAQSFESLVRLRALPGHGDIDPSRLMTVFLPLFFGMILGDAGYGAVLLALSLLGRRWIKTGVMHDLLQILTLGAGWAIVFGLLFGEIFGTLGEELGFHALWFHRASPEHITSLLLLAVGVGAVHIALGLIIGVIEAFQHKHRSHLLERGGMLIALVGLFLLVGTLAELLPNALLTPASAGLIVGVVLLGSSMGWLGILLGPIEFIGLIGNILSYLRIAAIGLASVFLAIVANEVAGVVGSLVVGIIVASLIHALNIALGAFSPTIHSLRLHYVEFFRKFFEGGGRPYEPFRSQLPRDEVSYSKGV